MEQSVTIVIHSILIAVTMPEPPRNERILRLAISVYGKREDRAAGHDFAVNNHVIKAAKIHASYGMQTYQQVSHPENWICHSSCTLTVAKDLHSP